MKQYPVTHTEAEWRKILTPEQYEIMREHGTEMPGSCALLHEKRAGAFHCAAVMASGTPRGIDLATSCRNNELLALHPRGTSAPSVWKYSQCVCLRIGTPTPRWGDVL